MTYPNRSQSAGTAPPATTGKLHLAPLRKLQDQGLDLAVLLVMQRDTLARAWRSIAMSGNAPQREQVLTMALLDMPQGARLMQAYSETAATMANRPVRELQTVAQSLAAAAQALESHAVRHLATTAAAPLPQQARGHHAIGERLAQLLQGANTLQVSGLVPAGSAQGKSLHSVMEFIENGPLSRFMDKANAILAARHIEIERDDGGEYDFKMQPMMRAAG